MKGKAKCKILKDIRKKIADSNDIPYVVSECQYQGDCKGTCPKCEQELRYLEAELKKRQAVGKAIAVTGIVASLALGSVGCEALNDEGQELSGDVRLIETTNDEELELLGEVCFIETTVDENSD